MCQGITSKGKKCKKKTEPYCHLHKAPKKTKYQRTIERGPRATDKAGHIYIYRLDADPDHYYKIGRTERTVEKRLAEWKNSILVRSFEVKFNRHVERLIHLKLDHCRIYRYAISETQFCDVWKANGEPVTERDALLKQENRLTAAGKQIEWVICYLDVIVDEIKSILLSIP
jgi:hypothetical protein